MNLKGSVIVVTWNSAPHVASCLRALRHHRNWERIIIDNASRDNTVECVRSADPEARLVINSENRGFAAGANQGVRIAEGELILLLNPDSTPSPGALEKIGETLQAEGVGAASGALVRPDGTLDIGFAIRRFPSPLTLLAEVLLVNRLWPSNPVNRRYRCMDLDYSRLQGVEQPAGACLGFKRAAWQDVGGFDERFHPIWFEDVDFCRRLRSRGWKIIFQPEAVFSHAGGQSVHQLPFPDRQVYWYRNLLRYSQKHHSAGATWTLRLAIGVGLLLRSMAALLGFNSRGVGVKESLRGYALALAKVCLRSRNEP